MYPQVIPNLYEFLSSVEHKITYLISVGITKQLMVVIDLHGMKKVLFI